MDDSIRTKLPLMADVPRCTYAEMAPGQATRAAWNQVLVEYQPVSQPLTIALDGVKTLSSGFLAALAPAENERLRQGGGLRLEASEDELRLLIRLVGQERLLNAIPNSMSMDLSCQVQSNDEEIVISVQATALQNGRLVLPGSYSWMRRLVTQRIVVDLGQLPHINSVLVAWILQIGQAAKPATLTLVNVSRQVNIQLTQLRLHHLMTVVTQSED
jgi:anti-anti-sigma regulatory factor